MKAPISIAGTRWYRLLLGLALAFAVFDVTATMLGSDRGQAGLLVCALVVAVTILCERALLGVPFAQCVGRFGRPAGRGTVGALAVSALLALVVPAYGFATGVGVTMYPGWPMLVPGVFAQAGIAEEALFRGYLFGHVREGRTFRRAVVLAAVPFVAVHLVLFARLPWAVALASVLLAAISTAPLAYAYELGGRTIWPAAILHTAIQGIPKVVVVEGAALAFALTWIVASAVVPFAVFMWAPHRPEAPPV